MAFFAWEGGSEPVYRLGVHALEAILLCVAGGDLSRFESVYYGDKSGLGVAFFSQSFYKLMVAGVLMCGMTPLVSSQATYTVTQTSDQGFGPLDTSPPTIPPDQIIQKFAAKESEFRRALDYYTYTRSVRVETLTEDGKVDGRYEETADISYSPDGRKLEKVTYAPANTMERITMTPADFSDIEHRLPFVLTAEDIPAYKVTYVGRQKVDELNTYVFDVAPKVLEKGRRYLQGRIWVDQQDLQIVLVNGKNVPDDTRKGHEDLSPPFTTYREQVDGKYWFPVYTKADATLHFPGGRGYMAQDVRIRYIVRYSDFKRFRSSVKITFEGQDISNGQSTPAPNGQQPAAPNTQQPPAPH